MLRAGEGLSSLGKYFERSREMKYLIKIEWPNERGNKLVGDPKFGEKMQALLKELKAEAAYFSTVEGHRGGYIVVNMDDASQMPAIGEPLFQWLNASVKFIPVMLPEELAKAGPAIAAAVQKWGR
jgi:hypothetical protein